MDLVVGGRAASGRGSSGDGTPRPACLRRVRDLRGSIPAGGGRYELTFDGNTVVLALIGPDGQPAGEYVGEVLSISDDATLPSLEIVVEPIVFEPTDPRYVPLGGPDGPRDLRLEIDYRCPI